MKCLKYKLKLYKLNQFQLVWQTINDYKLWIYDHSYDL